jgi:isopropylmalate/homocitrate/citramalate synthase
MKKIIYPNCNITFKKWLYVNKNYLEFYNSIKPRVFDVTLRDGLQSIKREEQEKYTTDIKLQIYNDIINKYNPNYIEIGSIVSKKILPIMSDSLEIYDKTYKPDTNNFLLVPSESKLQDALNHNCYNISLISSVSEQFQLSNTKKTLEQTKSEILGIMYELYSNPKIKNPRVKLYLSCIDHCPISGQIPLDFIASEITYYNQICKPDIICLSDTCGNLSSDNFILLVNMINKLGVPSEKLSLHLHVDKNNIENSQQIFSIALDRNILEFDISLLDSGGCSVTMGSKTKPNLSYELYYKFLCDYIMHKIKD